MHTVYHTDAIVIDEKPFGEAGKFFTLFTKDFGLIRAHAQGVRYEKSKLRFAISKYAKVHVALVQGKTGWKITNAYADLHIYHTLGNTSEFRIVDRIFSLLTRLVQGEESNTELFETLDSSINFLINNTDSVLLNDIECVIVLRILNNLGYVGDHKDIKFFVVDNALKNEHIEEMNKNRNLVLKEINRALKESQL